MKYTVQIYAEQLQHVIDALEDAGRNVDAFYPSVHIPDKFFVSVPIQYTVDGVETYSFVDHPAFAELRNALEARKWICCDKNSINGDVVLRPFCFNGKRLAINDRFYCAAAWGNILRVRS